MSHRLRTALFSILLAGVCLVTLAQATPEIPGATQEKPIVLTGATVHPVSGPGDRKRVVLFDKGKLVGIGRELKIPEGAQIIDVAGKHIYPGLIDANTQLGLIEIPSVRGTVDQAETGDINPNVKAQVRSIRTVS